MTDDTVPAPSYAPRPFGSAQTDSSLAVEAQPAAALAETSPKRSNKRWRGAGLAAWSVFAVAIAALYATSPLVAAWSIREAVRTGDSDYLRTAIDWPRIKDTLKVSMSRYALAGGEGESIPISGDGDETVIVSETAAKPSLWQRIKIAYGRRVVHGMVESYVTPEGLPTLFKLRNGFNKTIGKTPVVPDDAGLVARVQGEWSRVRVARFETPTRFAVEMDDKFEAGRRIAGVLEFEISRTRIGWRLVSLEVKRAGESASAAVSRFAGAAH